MSVTGKAKLSEDRERIKKLFVRPPLRERRGKMTSFSNPIVSAWFGDLGVRASRAETTV